MKLMKVELVSDKERKVYKIGDSKIFYRRIPTNIMNGFIKRYTRRGITDWIPVTDEALKWAVLGWENFVFEGKDVEYSFENLQRLPSDIGNDIVIKFGIAEMVETGKSADSKNS